MSAGAEDEKLAEEESDEDEELSPNLKPVPVSLTVELLLLVSEFSFAAFAPNMKPELLVLLFDVLGLESLLVFVLVPPNLKPEAWLAVSLSSGFSDETPNVKPELVVDDEVSFDEATSAPADVPPNVNPELEEDEALSATAAVPPNVNPELEEDEEEVFDEES